ncbi:specifically androgen-regulated gene protein-like isoform X2 [Poecilia reticulata]|uniref:specifically androgen-regulated gene protein-like isoform X2 n=1 Tax=Poecilia reticulata TaxID=8081 RepID=UPI0004A4465E|nr:PREDICTED: specifically androgen-regulated gene protein-like isoform X2 [Poecilia reticulata]
MITFHLSPLQYSLNNMPFDPKTSLHAYVTHVVDLKESEDSMEYLSAEEKACLMFLEETIEALEVQEDSGLSNDEPDVWSKTEPQDQISNGILRISSPTPHTTADPPSAGSTTECETEHHAANQNSNPQSASMSAVGVKNVKTENLGVETDPSVSNSGYTTSSSDKTTDVSKLDGDLELENITNSGDASENDLDIIPPPTDFRDEPEPDLLLEAMTVVPPPAAMTVEAMSVVPPPETMTMEATTVILPPEATTMVPPPEAMTVEAMTVVPPPAVMTVEATTVIPPSEATTVVPPPEATAIVSPPSNDFTKQKRTVDLEQMRLRASVKRSVVDSSTAEDSSSKASDVASLLPQMNPPTEPSEPRNPPAVAPKPKKLPSNIILKSPMSPTHVSHGNPGHSVPSHSDRMLLDPQKVRMEALKKLGLLKDNKEESSRAVSPKLPQKSAAYKRSLASPSPPVSPASHTPPVTPSLTPVISPLQAPVLQQSALAPTVSPSASSVSPPIQDADILPAPAAFSDGFGPSGDGLPAVTEATFSTLPNTSSPKVISMKFATLERSGLGLSSQMSNQSLLEVAGGEQDPKQLRNTRPRPVSLGTGKDFSHAKGEGLVASGTSEFQKPQPTQAFHHRESSRLPRSQGISVMICPRPENEEDRRHALKKLGLLRD